MSTIELTNLPGGWCLRVIALLFASCLSAALWLGEWRGGSRAGFGHADGLYTGREEMFLVRAGGSQVVVAVGAPGGPALLWGRWFWRLEA